MGKLAGSLLGGGGAKGKTSSSSQVVVPAWLDTKMQSLAGRAETLSNRGFTPNTLQKVFDFSPDTMAAFQGVRDAQGRFNPNINQAAQGAQDLYARGAGPTSADIQSRMNPFLQNVLDISKREAIKDYQRSNANLARQKGLAGAFGGSRMAIQEAELNKNFAQQLQDQQYQGQFDAFANARDQFNRDTDVLGQSVNANLNAAQTGQQVTLQDLEALLSAGGQQQLRQQAQLDADLGEFDRQQAYDYEQLNFLSNILNPQLNAYRGETSNSTSKQGSSGSKAGNLIGTALSIGSFFSDERVKENIEEVGELDNGLTVYKYNYKGDPRTLIGLIAQEVEKSNPEAVSESEEGIKMVNYDVATQGTDDQYEEEGGEAETENFAEGGRVSMSRERTAKQLVNSGISPLGFRGAPTPTFSSGDGGQGLSNLLKQAGKPDVTTLSSGEQIMWNGPRQGEFLGSRPGFDMGDFGDIGSKFASLFGFAEGGAVRPGTQKYIDSLLGQYSPEDILLVAEKQKQSGMSDDKGRALWTQAELDYLKNLTQKFAEGGAVKSPMDIMTDRRSPAKKLNMQVPSIPDPAKVAAGGYGDLANFIVGGLRSGKDVQFNPKQGDSRLSVAGQAVGTGLANIVGNTVDAPFAATEAVVKGAGGLKDWLTSPYYGMDSEAKPSTQVAPKQAPATTPAGVPLQDPLDAAMAKKMGMTTKALPFDNGYVDDIVPALDPATAMQAISQGQDLPPMMPGQYVVPGAGPGDIAPLTETDVADGGVYNAGPTTNVNTAGGEDLFQQLIQSFQKRQETPVPVRQTIQGPFGEINVPLLQAGIAMLSTEGNFAKQAGAGFQGYLQGKQDEVAASLDEAQREQKRQDENISSLMDMVKLKLAIDQANKGDKGLTPLEQIEKLTKIKDMESKIDYRNKQGKLLGNDGLLGGLTTGDLTGNNQNPALDIWADDSIIDAPYKDFNNPTGGQ